VGRVRRAARPPFFGAGIVAEVHVSTPRRAGGGRAPAPAGALCPAL